MDLRLYVINSAKYKGVIDMVTDLLKNGLPSKHNLEVINVLEYPDRAEEDNIIVTPTLINMSAVPPRRVVGSMADKEKIILALSVKEA